MEKRKIIVTASDHSTAKTPQRRLGDCAEARVANWLCARGFTIVATNYRKRFGEVDIIARRAEVLAFVEVKMRRHVFFALSQVITPRKQKKIAMVAKEFLATYPHEEMVYRFDVALVEQDGDTAEITYFPNAFVPSDL